MITHSAIETKEIGKQFAQTLKGNETIALFGEAGSGKTVFTKGLCEGLNVKELITSPTFVIMNIYKGKFFVFHYDMYRITNSGECAEINFYENLEQGINIIEWAENITDILPKNCIKIRFSYGNKENERILNFESLSY